MILGTIIEKYLCKIPTITNINDNVVNAKRFFRLQLIIFVDLNIILIVFLIPVKNVSTNTILNLQIRGLEIGVLSLHHSGA